MTLRTRFIASALLTIAGCSGSGTSTPDLTGVVGQDMAAQTLYEKYGGAPTVQKIVDDAVAALLNDCNEVPYFSVIGTTGHDSVDRLKGCLVLQFTVALGGPGTYPGMNAAGDMCGSMSSVHAALGIPGAVFDQFIVDVAGVLTADGVSSEDLLQIAPTFTALKADIVSATPVLVSACNDGGATD